eukprot:scaffold131785_cov37-Attheya_sp.AAC.2
MSKNGSRSKSRALHNKPNGKIHVPWCTDFGDSKEERKEKFPDAKFCSKCEDWENEGPNTRSKQTSRRFACQANLGPNWFMAVQVKELKAATDNIAALNAEKHRLGKK